MTTITGQLSPADPRKEVFVPLADESGINATLWYGAEFIIVQVNRVGAIDVVYDDGRGNRKSLCHFFFRDLPLTNNFCMTEEDGRMVVE